MVGVEGGGVGHSLWGMVRAKTKVAALQPTACAAWLQAWMSMRYSVKWRRPLSTARSRGTLSSRISKSELFPPSRRAPEARRCLPEEPLGRARVRARRPHPGRTPQPWPRPRSPLRALIDGRHLPGGSGETREGPVTVADGVHRFETHPQPGAASTPHPRQDTPSRPRALASPHPAPPRRRRRTWGW